MARILPTDWRSARPGARTSVVRELETLETLQAGLPDAMLVFHGVHWSRTDGGIGSLGEIDFVVLAPSGRVLLIEQKSGFLAETEAGLAKRYAGGTKLVRPQIDRTLQALYQRLAQVADGEPLSIDYLLYCPDHRVRSVGTAGIAPERIVDAGRREQLCARIMAALGDAPARGELAQRLRRFFANELQLAVDVSTLVGRASELVTRLAGGLATWARRIELDPFRLRVIGTAGSGKTQLALALLEDAAAAGRRAMYVCFNRPLADHMRRIAPPEVHVYTYHHWCEQRVREAGGQVDFGRPDAFERLERDAAALAADPAAQVDWLVIDEGQDMTPTWRDMLLAQLAPAGHCWWLEDPMQNLYARPPTALPGWAELRAPVNYRSPRAIVRALARLIDGLEPIEGAGPVDGDAPEFLTYADGAGLLEATKRAVTSALQAGFRRSDLALVTFSGRERSALMRFDALGPHRLRAFTGRYDLLGNPEYGQGDLLIETVYRFKGQSAPCVVLTEVDFAELDEQARRKLFVGLTRASMRAFVVASERAARVLRARLA